MASASINIKGFAAWCEVDVLRIRWMVVICARKSEKCQIFGHFFAFFEGDHGKKGSDLLLSKTFFSTFVNNLINSIIP